MTLRADNIQLQFGRKTVLDRVSLDCRPGELLALCGPNGAGKSSLLKVLTGDLNAQSGEVLLNGKNIRTMSPLERARQRAVMPQSVDVAFPFQAKSVIEMGLMLVQDPREKTAILELVCALLKLDELLDRDYQKLSGGERQRIQLARVIGQLMQQACSEQKYLLLDECSSAMDMAMVHLAFHVVRQLVDDSHFGEVGVVAVVHDLNIASLYADRIALLHDQRICVDGTPDQVVTKHHIEQVFNTPVMVMDHPEHHRPVIIQG